jgi:hypothetical protein
MSAALALQQAVHATLAADATLAALIGAGIYDGPQRNAAPPYLHFGDASERDWSTGTEAGAEVAFAIVALSRERGRNEALGILERVRAVLHDAVFAVDGWRLVTIRFVATESGRGDGGGRSDRGDMRRAAARFRARLEPIS